MVQAQHIIVAQVNAWWLIWLFSYVVDATLDTVIASLLSYANLEHS